jgi:hypothetical protein
MQFVHLRRWLGLAGKGLGLVLVMAAIASPAWAGGPLPTPGPEIDPGAMGGALALLTGGVLLLTDRFRRK